MIGIKISDKYARFPKAAEPLVVWERVKREPNRKGSLLLLLVPFVNTKGTARRGMSDKSKKMRVNYNSTKIKSLHLISRLQLQFH